MEICDFDPMRTRAGISTSHIHFILSKTVSAVPADATEVPTSRHKTRYTGVKWIKILKPKKICGKKLFSLHYDQKKIR